VTISSWLNFGRPAPPGRGLRWGEIFWLGLTTARSQCFVSSERLLHCALSLAVQCIVISPVCVFVGVCVCVCLWVCYQDGRNWCDARRCDARNCVHRSLPNWVCRWRYSDHLQLIKFWPSRAPGKGVCGGTKFLPTPYYIQRAVFASLWALFSFSFDLKCSAGKGCFVTEHTRVSATCYTKSRPPKDV